MHDTKVIIVGNEKGGSGKTTVAMHIITALMRAGFKVGAMDLDIRQKSLSRYLENRAKWAIKNDLGLDDLPIPILRIAPYSNNDSRAESKAIETAGFKETMMRYSDCDYLVIDCPGADTHLSRVAHMHADTIITPMNDSFIDFDLLARMDPDDGSIIGPSFYSEMVYEARQKRASTGAMGGIDWVVIRNRLGAVNAKNRAAVGSKLGELSSRIGFRTTDGFAERVIYRELFSNGLTLLDLKNKNISSKLGAHSSMTHVTARQEIRRILSFLKLPLKNTSQRNTKLVMPESKIIAMRSA